MADTPRRRLTRTIVVGASAVLVVAALAVTLLWSTGALAQVGGGNTVTPVGVLEFPADGILIGGRTYRFPDGSWLIDVPEGMRLEYKYTGESPRGTDHGLRDVETGSLIAIGQHTGEILRAAGGDTSAEVAVSEARLNLIEAAFRRAPEYVPPPQTSAQRSPELNENGIPILFAGGIFAGGRTYVIPGLTSGEPVRLLEAPPGIGFEFGGSATEEDSGRIFYIFRDDERRWEFIVMGDSGHVIILGDDSDPHARALASAASAAFRPPPPSDE